MYVAFSLAVGGHPTPQFPVKTHFTLQDSQIKPKIDFINSIHPIHFPNCFNPAVINLL